MRGVGKHRVAQFVLLLAAVGSSVAAGSALGGVRATAGACTITQTHSITGLVKTNIVFLNKTAGTVKVYWLDYSGKRVYYSTLAPGASYTQRTFVTHPWVILNSAGACVGYVIAPHSQYVISGSASSAVPQPTTPPPAAAMPHWVYQMINDFNLGISQPSGALSSSLQLHQECVAVPPNWYFVDGNSRFFISVIKTSFLPYSNLLGSWIAQTKTLKSSPVTTQARAKLLAAQPLHAQEVSAWVNAEAAIKAHNCGAFLNDLRAAATAGAPEWADQYAAVKAIAGLYGHSGSASHQTPYAQEIG